MCGTALPDRAAPPGTRAAWPGRELGSGTRAPKQGWDGWLGTQSMAAPGMGASLLCRSLQDCGQAASPRRASVSPSVKWAALQRGGGSPGGGGHPPSSQCSWGPEDGSPGLVSGQRHGADRHVSLVPVTFPIGPSEALPMLFVCTLGVGLSQDCSWPLLSTLGPPEVPHGDLHQHLRLQGAQPGASQESSRFGVEQVTTFSPHSLPGSVTPQPPS